MCGRFFLNIIKQDLEAQFEVPLADDLQPRFNISPSQKVLGLCWEERERPVWKYLQWGLVPHWAKDVKSAYRTINARAETLKEKPSYREAYKKRRCLIPANGYYEWVPGTDGKQPHAIIFNQPLIAFGGLWEIWNKGAERLSSCSIITGPSRQSLAHIHHREPLVIDNSAYQVWINPDTPFDQIDNFCNRSPQVESDIHKVSKSVNNPANEGRELLRPID